MELPEAAFSTETTVFHRAVMAVELPMFTVLQTINK